MVQGQRAAQHVLRPIPAPMLTGLVSRRPDIESHDSQPARPHPHSLRATMSNAPSPSTPRSNLDPIFNAALKTYKNKTGKDLTSHPLATELQSCDSPDAMLAVLGRQIPALDQSQSHGGDESFVKYLVPTVNVLYTLSDTLGEGVGLVISTMSSLLRIRALTSCSQVFSPARVIFAGIGVLLLVCSLLSSWSRCSPFDTWSVFRQSKT